MPYYSNCNTNGNRHLTKKAVILNSADKIKGIIGMERTVVKEDGMTNWLGTDAHSDPAIPVDREMGVGHLNAKRAVEQHAAGERPGGGALIGWDYATQNDPFIPNKYTLSLNPGDYVSATLVWDREVFLNSPFLEYQRGDEFIDFGFANLDLYLVVRGDYDADGDVDGQDYNIWRANFGTTNAMADGNENGTVDAADYVVWRKSLTAGSGTLGDTSVPEPSGLSLLATAFVMFLGRRNRAK